MTKLDQLEKDLLKQLNDDMKYILAEQYPEEMLYEYIDNAIPIYNDELLQVFFEEGSNLTIDDQGLWEYDKNLTPFMNVLKLIQTGIYCHLSQPAFKWLDEQQEQM